MSTAPTREHQNQGPEVIKKHQKIIKIIKKSTTKPSRNVVKKKTRFLSKFSSILDLFWVPLGPPGSTFLLKKVRPRGRKQFCLRFWLIFCFFHASGCSGGLLGTILTSCSPIFTPQSQIFDRFLVLLCPSQMVSSWFL